MEGTCAEGAGVVLIGGIPRHQGFVPPNRDAAKGITALKSSTFLTSPSGQRCFRRYARDAVASPQRSFYAVMLKVADFKDLSAPPESEVLA